VITAGFDIGTRFHKICLVEDGRIIASSCREAGRNPGREIRSAYLALLDSTGLKPRSVARSIATGHGAGLVDFAAYELSDAACIARAVSSADPSIRTVIDVGALFIRIVSIDENGFLDDSTVNDPCAAGSGKFLELVSEALEIPFKAISERASLSRRPYAITSACAVFAESEVISQLNAGIPSEDIMAGVVQSIISKVLTLLVKAGASECGRTALTGGVSELPLFREQLARSSGRDLAELPIDARIAPAYGAALLAQGRHGKAHPRTGALSFVKALAQSLTHRKP
jgi:predicted CoA-substrate-specific enzyme activase